jgi:ligand-binding sensor domain-containing protein/C4-dicarboxylate-specific signal transduction histidine kinase
MKIHLKYLQWLFFWFSTCLPLTNMAAADISSVGTPSAGVRASTTPTTPSLAQNFPSTEPTFEFQGDERTIDNQVITHLAQDARGLIWIGTELGLFRYDGYRFRKFTHKLGDPFSLAGDYIYSLYPAPDGRLWVGTLNDGVSVFDPATERFENFRHDEKIPDSLGEGSIWAMISDGRGGMWIATEQGLNHLPRGTKRFTHFKNSTDPRSLMSNKVRSLLLDKVGRLWVGNTSGLQRLAPDGKGFETILVDREVEVITPAQDGKLWLGTKEHGVAWLDPSQPVPQQVHWLPTEQMSYPWISKIIQMKTGQIWVATYGGGIMIISPDDGQVLQTLRSDPALPSTIAFDTIGSLLVDRAGWIWVGTWGFGLQRMNANNTMVRNLKHSPKRPNGVSDSDIWGVLELANGQLLISAHNKVIDIFDRQKGKIGEYKTGSGEPGALPEAILYTMAETNDGAIWVSTEQHGVLRKPAGSTTWSEVPGSPSKLVRKLFTSRDGSLWVGSDTGVARWKPNPQPNEQTNKPPTTLPKRSATPVHLETLLDEHGNAVETNVWAFAEDEQGRVWIGTQNGLWLFDPGHRGLIRIPADPKRPDGLISDRILGLLFDHLGRLWISTDKGLERLISRDGKLTRFEHISALLGMPGKPLGSNLLEDGQGRIWTERAVIEPGIGPSGKPRYSPLTLADGIEIGTPWEISYAKTHDGLLLFGGTKGLAVIDPTHFKAYDYAPPLIVTEIKINGVVVAPAMLVKPQNQQNQGKSNTNFDKSALLTLQPAQRNFAIEFAALDYAEPMKNRYQYRLQGYDKTWINTNADQRTANYGNLWPGSYTLQVRGTNRMGEWSRHELYIPIRVLPAWWQTWWFVLVLLLLMTGIVASLIQMRTRYLRQRQQALEQLVNERTGELHQKQGELIEANNELNQSNEALNDAIEALNQSNAGLELSVETLRQLSEIGRKITSNLDADSVFQSLYMYVSGMLNAPAMTIYRMNASATELNAVFARNGNKMMPMLNISLDSLTSNAARVVRERQELLLNYDQQSESTYSLDTREMLTALFAPLIVDDKVLGVMSIQSDRENAYDERECLIFRTLTAYGAIALANSAAIGALRQAQGQLVQQEKMASLGGLVAGIAHEINTPLGTTLVAISGVEGSLQTLQNAISSGSLSKAVLVSSTSEGMEYAALALQTAKRTAELIAMFKTISVSADSDRSVTINLAHYLEEVATLVHTQLVQNGCELEVVAPINLSIQVVADALTETLSRILVNALNHGFDQGRTGTLRLCATIDKAADGDEVVITVSDDGHGIAPEDLPKVFDPFFTTKSGIQGHVGLGLHVAYNHVTERLKGKIQITSTLGEGTCVTIRLSKT